MNTVRARELLQLCSLVLGHDNACYTGKRECQCLYGKVLTFLREDEGTEAEDRERLERDA